jgi:hypothetical protein
MRPGSGTPSAPRRWHRVLIRRETESWWCSHRRSFPGHRTLCDASTYPAKADHFAAMKIPPALFTSDSSSSGAALAELRQPLTNLLVIVQEPPILPAGRSMPYSRPRAHPTTSSTSSRDRLRSSIATSTSRLQRVSVMTVATSPRQLQSRIHPRTPYAADSARPRPPDLKMSVQRAASGCSRLPLKPLGLPQLRDYLLSRVPLARHPHSHNGS